MSTNGSRPLAGVPHPVPGGPGGRWRVSFRYLPGRRLAGLVALTSPFWLLSATGAGPWPALIAGALVLVAAVVDALLIPGRAHLAVRRTLPEAVGLGDVASAAIEVRSAWPVRLHVEVNEPPVRGLERTRPAPDPDAPWRVGRARIGPRDVARIEYQLTGRERGEHEIGPVVLRVAGPMGLMRRTLTYPLPATVRVLPSLAGVRRLRLLAIQHRLRDAGIRAIRRRGDGSSFANLREYVEGDDPRRVDWKATARRGKLIAREYAHEQGQTVVIAIDAGRMMTQLAGGVPRFEHALSAATVLADVATRSGDHVALLVFNDAVRAFVPPTRGALALRLIRDATLDVTPNMAEPDYTGAFRALARRHRKRSLLVLFTDVVDPRASRALIAYTTRSAARHLPLVVAFRNDDLAEAAIPRPDAGDRALFESAGAEELLLEREEALARMRRAGVSVLDVSPRELAAAVVNRYLEVKARGVL